MQQSRRTFLGRVAVLGTAISLSPFNRPIFAAPAVLPTEPMDPALVKDFVGKAHSDLERVKELFEQQPNIIHSTWDWGAGDFETALGAAGHVGRRDIAEFLIEKGARPDLFALTMLGETEIVKATLERYPAFLNSIGPHGFTLLHHAQRGGEAAQNLVDYLTEKGVTQSFIDVFGKNKK